MDESTQQNAALVEQAAAAAQSLQDQASTLAGLVNSFRIDAAQAHGVQAAPAPAAAPRPKAPAPAAIKKPAAATRPAPAKPIAAAAAKTNTAAAAKPATQPAAKSPSRLPTGDNEGDWETF